MGEGAVVCDHMGSHLTELIQFFITHNPSFIFGLVWRIRVF